MSVGTIRLNAVISSFLGDTASHIQKVFDLADSRPIVLLLDEIDAIAKNRDGRNDVGELKRVVNTCSKPWTRLSPVKACYSSK